MKVTQTSGLIGNAGLQPACKAQARGLWLRSQATSLSYGLVVAAYFFLLTSAFAGNHYVRAGASGNGNDWGVAFGALPGTLVRGDTYYISDGNYGALTLNTPGSTYITIKKATAGDHGTDTGWDSTYGDGVAVFSTFAIYTSYWIINGQTGGGPSNWKGGFGFKIDASNHGGVGINAFDPISNLQVSHLEIQGHGPDNNAGSQDGLSIGSAFDGRPVGTGGNIVFSYLYIHDLGRTPIFNRAHGVTIEYSRIGKFESTAAQHAEVASVWRGVGSEPVTDFTVRYCFITDAGSPASTGGFIVGNGDRAKYYGNIFAARDGGTFTAFGNGLIGTWSANTLKNALIYNNTFIGPASRCFGLFDNPGGNSTTIRNNLFYQTTVGNDSPYGIQNPSGTHIHSHNHSINITDGPLNEASTSTGTVNPFVNPNGEDYRLTANTPPGTDLGSPYNVDMFGNARTSWTRGAIEHGGAPPSPTPTPTPTPTPGPSPVILLSTPALNFKSVLVNGTPADLTATITNTGTGTLTGTASVAAPFSIVAPATYNIAPRTTANIKVRYRPTVKANDQQTITFTGGGGATAYAIGICYPLMPSLTFAADAGIVTQPFTATAGIVSQNIDTQNGPDGDDPIYLSGRVSYGITIATEGDYMVSSLVEAPTAASNSFRINLDGEPTDPDKIWDITQLTATPFVFAAAAGELQSRQASWRGTGTFDMPQYQPKVFHLTSGVHELVVRGREPNTRLGTITVNELTEPPVCPDYSSLPTAYKNALRLGQPRTAAEVGTSRYGTHTVCLNESWFATSQANVNMALDAVNAGGWTWVKDYMKGCYTAGDSDAVVKAGCGAQADSARYGWFFTKAAALGLKVYIRLDFSGPDAKFAIYATEMVHRYKTQVHDWEIANEPDLVLPDHTSAAATYATTAQVVAAAILAEDPTAHVYGPAASNLGGMYAPSPQWCPDAPDALGYLQALFSHGSDFLRNVTAVSMHAYRPGPPETASVGCGDGSNYSKSYRDQYVELRDLVNRKGGTSTTPIAMSEGGYPASDADLNSLTRPARDAALRLQAKYEQRWAILDYVNDLRPRINYTLVTQFVPYSTWREANFRIMDPDATTVTALSPRPAYYAAQAVNSIFDDELTYRPDIPVNVSGARATTTVEKFVFTRPSDTKELILVLWKREETTETVSVYFPGLNSDYCSPTLIDLLPATGNTASQPAALSHTYSGGLSVTNVPLKDNPVAVMLFPETVVNEYAGNPTPTPIPTATPAPNGRILSPIANWGTVEGGTVTFTGLATDPGGLSLTYNWNFGASGVADSTVLSPGAVTFDNEGQFTVTFTVTNSAGRSDPTPDTRIITVAPAASPTPTPVPESPTKVRIIR